MFDERKEKLRREAGRSSGFISRKEHVKKDAGNSDMTGLLQRKTGEEGEQIFSETFHKENAYGHISLGASQKNELGLVVSGKQEYHESPAKENERVLDLNRSKRQDRNIQGEIKTNLHEERESALGLFSGKMTTESQMLAKLKAAKKTLIVTDGVDEVIYKSARNIEGVKVVTVNTLCVYDILNCDSFVVLKDAAKKIEEVYA